SSSDWLVLTFKINKLSKPNGAPIAKKMIMYKSMRRTNLRTFAPSCLPFSGVVDLVAARTDRLTSAISMGVNTINEIIGTNSLGTFMLSHPNTHPQNIWVHSCQ